IGIYSTYYVAYSGLQVKPQEKRDADLRVRAPEYPLPAGKGEVVPWLASCGGAGGHIHHAKRAPSVNRPPLFCAQRGWRSRGGTI
ncbi:MAG: hypothetical protein KDE02_19360, partial [Rhodobacteraceae bacterium]|nr:hypothetical protein [Paracoccaceae bacterium]